MLKITDLAAYQSREKDRVRAVLGKLNASEHLFQLILNDQDQLVGTVTDGDIRRALLDGHTLESTIGDCSHRGYSSGREGQAAENLRLLSAGLRLVNFLPILDEGGRVVEVLLSAPGQPSIHQALVMAGGFGKRLGERTSQTPKPLVEVGGKPILDHVLCNLEAAGVARLFVSVHYLSDQIVRFLESRENLSTIEILVEEHPLGTAGSLSLLPDGITGPILVVNGDVISNVDFTALDLFHRRHGCDATIGATRHDVEMPYGVIRHDESGLFSGIDEKPRLTHLVAAGIYLLSQEYLGLTAKNQSLDMPTLLNLGRNAGLRAGIFPIHEYWTDVGRPTDLDQADHYFSQAGAGLVASTSGSSS